MIDEIDLEIISRLEDDGRTSNAKLANSLGVSAVTVAKRINKLIEKKVFTINAVPNHSLMGYRAWAVICMKVSMDKVDDLCTLLRQSVYVNLITLTFGRFNLLIRAHFPNWELFHDFFSTYLMDKRDIYKVEVFFVDEIKEKYRNIPENKRPQWKSVNIDSIDERIIEELTIDGRTSYKSLAEKLNISISSIANRVNLLVDNNIINIRARVNLDKIGYTADAFIFIEADNKKMDEINRIMEDNQHIINKMMLANGYDMLLVVVAQDPEMLYELIYKKIASIPGIINVETLIRGPIIKRYYGGIHISKDIISFFNSRK